MSVFRVEKTKNYTIMSNYHLKEKEMSLKAKGLLSLMLSLPDTWDYTIAGLVSICKENETAIKSALNELKEFGYLQIVKNMPTNENGGRISYEYIVYEKPIQKDKIQGLENLYVENQDIENQRQLNTKELNTKKENTNNKDIMLSKDIKCIIDYLNESIGSKYKYTTKGTINCIKARFKDGFVLDDFYNVIDKKVKEWLNTDMEKYLRPETLFGNKFENYLNQKTYFKGTPKTSYSSKPTFDNTATHIIPINNLTIEEYEKLDFKQKQDYLSSYSSKPTFDNTKDHEIQNKISLEEYEKLDFKQKQDYLSSLPIADMTKEQKEFFNKYCLARDENGNLLKF